MGGVVTPGGPGLFAGGPAGGSTAGNVITTVIGAFQWFGSLAKTIRDNAKRKKAMKIANAGGYYTLTDYQKSLIGYRNPALYGTITDESLDSPAIPLPSPAVIILVAVLIILYQVVKDRFK
jgi:hypothetical protein